MSKLVLLCDADTLAGMEIFSFLGDLWCCSYVVAGTKYSNIWLSFEQSRLNVFIVQIKRV
jgi:hypothetical protein